MTGEGNREDRQVYKIMIEAPIETVWSLLVKTDEVLPFFFGSVCETTGRTLQTGARMRMITPSRKNVAVIGEVLEFTPPTRYSHTLRFTQYDDPPTIITYDLKDLGGRTEFSLIQDRVPVGTKTAKSMASGAPLIAKTLKSLAERGKAGFPASMIMALGPLMEMVTPKRCRAENWPLDSNGNWGIETGGETDGQNA